MHRLYPNSFLIDLRLASGCPRLALESDRHSIGALDLYIEILNRKYLRSVVNAEYFAVYFGDRLHSCDQYLDNKCISQWDGCEDNGCFVYYNSRSTKVNVFSDFLGTEMVYYRRLADRIIISNRLDNFRLISDPQVDTAALLQFLHGVYTVGDRTLISETRKTRPLSRLEIDVNTGDIEEHRAGRWSGGETREATFEEVADRWQSVLDSAPSTVLMLSAGWDSRLLLAANSKRISAAYTHGDLRSREIRIAFDIARQYVPQVVLRALEESSYGIDALSERVRQLGHAFYPHWYNAAQYFSRLNEDPTSAGLFVEHFSGHYGVNSVGQGKAKLVATIKSMLTPGVFDRLSREETIAMALRLLDGRLKTPWYLSTEWLAEQSRFEEETRADIERILVGFYEEGTGGIQEIFERFRLEHAGRQYFALQTKCSIPFNGYHHPFADSRLAQLVFSIPYSKRVNYRLSQAVLRQLNPGLLEWPMAATTIKAKWPVVVQEMSRGVRILTELVVSGMSQREQLHLGWNNFQFIFSTGVFDDYIDHLSGDIWPKEQMRKAVRRMSENGTSGYSVLHMFSKILTADYLLFGRD